MGGVCYVRRVTSKSLEMIECFEYLLRCVQSPCPAVQRSVNKLRTPTKMVKCLAFNSSVGVWYAAKENCRY